MSAAGAGCTLAHYRLEAPLGYGGMGVVFLASDTRLGQQVAVKVLPSDRLNQPARRRVRDQALRLTRLTHPNVAAVLDVGSHGDIDYVVMEFVPGTTLDVMLRNGPLDPNAVVSLGIQLGSGLGAAHASGIVHRDIKPANLRVTPEGVLKILDFGAATFAGAPVRLHGGAAPELEGTVQYMPPERLRGTPAGPCADIFSAGAVLYEMACGCPPFHDTLPARLIESILSTRPPRPSTMNPRVDRGLESIILRALDPDPGRRFARAADLSDALSTLQTPKPIPGRMSIVTLGRWASRMASALIT